MSDPLDDLIDIHTTADILGIRHDSARMLIGRGRIAPARFIGKPGRGMWITTYAAVARYQAEKDARYRARRAEKERRARL